MVHHLGVVQGQVEALCHPPDPCLPDPAMVGQLGAVTNELDALDERVKAVLGIEPEPFLPGYSDLLGAAQAVYGGARNVLVAAADAKMGVDPEPFSPLWFAFVEVEGAAGDIQSSVAESDFCRSAGTLNPCTLDLPA